MVVTLYGSPITTCTKRVLVVMKELDLPYNFVPIDVFKGEHKSKEFLEKQPFGQVPYIEDDGFVLYESRAICRYLAAEYPNGRGRSLLPSESKARALFEQAVSVEQANFDVSARALAGETHYKKLMQGLEPDQVRVAEYITTFNGKLDAYEAILGKQKFLAGDELTLADLFHLPYGVLAKESHPELFSSRPHLAKWFEGLDTSPAWIAVKDGIPTSA